MVFDEQTDCYVPVFHVLLTSKTQQIYTQALRWVEITVRQKISPSTITYDFEIALQNAILNTFPSVVINGCLFHWKQAIRRKIIDLNFKESVCERLMWENTLEVLTVVNPSEITWKGIPYIRAVDRGQRIGPRRHAQNGKILDILSQVLDEKSKFYSNLEYLQSFQGRNGKTTEDK